MRSDGNYGHFVSTLALPPIFYLYPIFSLTPLPLFDIVLAYFGLGYILALRQTCMLQSSLGLEITISHLSSMPRRRSFSI